MALPSYTPLVYNNYTTHEILPKQLSTDTEANNYQYVSKSVGGKGKNRRSRKNKKVRKSKKSGKTRTKH